MAFGGGGEGYRPSNSALVFRILRTHPYALWVPPSNLTLNPKYPPLSDFVRVRYIYKNFPAGIMSRASLARGIDNSPAKKRKPSAVNPRHKQVVDAIMEGATESEAMRAAGYHPSHGANLMRKEEVQGMLAEARAEVEDLTTIKRLDVLNIFMEAIDMARTLADPGQMINGADKVAKMMGYYAPEKKLVELSVGQNVLQAKFQQMTDEELLEIAAGRAKVVDGEVLE